jgi:hypothetical protein
VAVWPARSRSQDDCRLPQGQWVATRPGPRLVVARWPGRLYGDADLKKLRANTSGAGNGGSNDDNGSRGDRRSDDGDSRGSNRGDDGGNDDSRTKLRLEPRCRLRLRL